MNSVARDPRAATIAVDVNGADLGVGEVVRGANIALAEGIRVTLYGPRDEIAAALDDPRGAATVVDAPTAISNYEEPATAVRAKRDASVVLGARAVADGDAGALVSAGPTGAMLAASLFSMKRIHGVKRPGLAVQVPDGRGGKTVLLDSGANVEVPAEMLVQFAALGAEFAKWVLGHDRPRVGLLSIGEEDGKGTERVVEAGRLLAAAAADPDHPAHFDYIGNVEGRDIPTDVVDVVVTDGFTGNVALKALEGAGQAMMRAIRDAIGGSAIATVGGLLARRQLRKLRDEIDPNTTGGAPLLGLRGVAIVAHGSSNAAGIAAAIRLANRSVEGGLVVHMTEAIDELRGMVAGGANGGSASESVVTVGGDEDTD